MFSSLVVLTGLSALLFLNPARDTARAVDSDRDNTNSTKNTTEDHRCQKVADWYNGELAMTFSKSEGHLKIFRNGELVYCLKAISGKNHEDKQTEGDRATPEGTFYICVKNPQSQYTRSLGISYPNTEDAERGRSEGLIDQDQYEHIQWATRSKTQPPWKTKLGGEIFIHGAKGTRRDTLGCISISDEQILDIFPRIALGTPMTITP